MTNSQKKIFTIGDKCPEIHDNMASLYPETIGAVMATKLITQIEQPILSKLKKLKNRPTIKIYIDNKEVIDRLNKKEHMKHNAKFYPMSSELAQISKQIFSKVNWIWIKDIKKYINPNISQ